MPMTPEDAEQEPPVRDMAEEWREKHEAQQEWIRQAACARARSDLPGLIEGMNMRTALEISHDKGDWTGLAGGAASAISCLAGIIERAMTLAAWEIRYGKVANNDT